MARSSVCSEAPAGGGRDDHSAAAHPSRPEVAEGLRNRRQLVVRAITPLVLLLTLSAVFAPDTADGPGGRGTYRVAVQGDMAGASATLAAARPPALDGTDAPPLTFTEADGAALAVTRRRCWLGGARRPRRRWLQAAARPSASTPTPPNVRRERRRRCCGRRCSRTWPPARHVGARDRRRHRAGRRAGGHRRARATTWLGW